ncbi:MAG TPA: translocation/assembly module TamB domain-containing protein [Candidatus Saccharimonadaceae bacterium]|jgi:hypothetical protein|nr:translocation/assembly module TamB domain-containing protein [Candidatus Saccharimonadaceae bacterium]
MTDPTPPDDPKPHPHGFAEEIREEIQEVVEHVPEPVRWTVGKIIRLAILGVFALIVLVVGSAVLYVANRTEWVAKELTLFLNQTLALHSDLALDIRDIRGNPFVGLTVVAPRVRFRDGANPPILEARSMRLGYSAWAFMAPGHRAVDVTLDHPVIRLTRGRDGKIRYPKWRGGGGGKNGPAPEIRLHLTMLQARVVAPDPEMNVDGGHLDVTVHTAPLSVDLANLSWTRGPYREPLERLAGEFAVGDSVTFRVRELRAPDLQLSAGGGWSAKGGERHVHLDLARVRWKLLARVFDNHSFDVPGEGSAAVDADGDTKWRGRFTATVDWDSLKGDGRGAFGWDGKRLALAPLGFTSPAGVLDGRVDWAHEGWSVGGLVQRGDPARWGALHLNGWPSGDLNGRFQYAVDTRPHGSGRISAQLVSSVLAGWRADSANFIMDMPDIQPDSFTVRMQRRGGEVALHARVLSNGWFGTYVADRFPLDEWPDGRASGIRGMLDHGAGGVEGHDGKVFVSGALAGAQTDWLGMHAARWKLDRVRGPMLDVPDMLADARLLDVMYLGLHFDSVQAGLHLGDGTLGIDSLRAEAADTVLDVAGRANWGRDTWDLTFDRADVKSSQFHWTAEPPVTLHGVPSGVTFDRLHARDGDATLDVTGRWAGPKGAYDWSAHARALDLGRLGLPVEWKLSGKAEATLEIQGVYGDPRWTFAARADAPGESGHAVDSLRLDLAGAPSRLEVKDAALAFRGGRLKGHATFAGTAHPWPDTLTAPGVLEWLAGASSWNGLVEAEKLPIDRLGALNPAADGWSGTLAGGVQLSGSPAHPQLDVHAHLTDGGWRDYRADDVEVRAHYAGTELTVDDARMTRRGVDSHLSGRLPLDLGLGRTPLVPDTPMSWQIDVPNGDLAIVPLFVEQIGSASGRFEISAHVTGTPKVPKIDGHAFVRDGRLRMAGREEVLEAVNARLSLDETHLTLDSLSARQGTRGRVTGSGRVDLSGFTLHSYAFKLSLRDFSAAEHGLYAAEFNGDFTVTNGPRVRGETLPLVVGRANIQRAVILFDFSNQNEMQQIAAATQPLYWTYRIEAVANSNLRWRPPEGEIEFAADLNLEQTRDSLIIFGDMQSLRGTYYFLSNRFTVGRANLTFDNVGGVNPTLDIEATTRILVRQDPNTSTETPHDIVVDITGRANAPLITLTDDNKAYAWDQAQILRQLTLGRVDVSQGLAGVYDPLDSYITQAINRSLSSDLSRAFGNYVSEWSLERDRGGLLNGTGSMILSAGSQINNKLSVKYSQVLPGLTNKPDDPTTFANSNLFERDVEAEYRINRFIYLTTQLAQRRVLSGISNPYSGTPDFNVNLKARWEY